MTGVKFGRTRTKLHAAQILAAKSSPQVIAGTLEVADNISVAVKTDLQGRRTLKGYGRKMVTGPTEQGARVGTTWGPAVPVEFGTYSQPGHRFLETAAERFGKIR